MNTRPPPPLMKIFLFGSFEVVLGGKKLEDMLWQSRQVRSVLKVLVTRRGAVTPRDQLVEMLWPEDDPETALKR